MPMNYILGGLKGFNCWYNYAYKHTHMITKEAKQRLKILQFWQNHGLKATADALERWNNRIVARGLHKQDEAGADQYLADYGKGIAAPKCVALAVACEVNGCNGIAMGFWAKAFSLETGIMPATEPDFAPGAPDTQGAPEGVGAKSNG